MSNDASSHVEDTGIAYILNHIRQGDEGIEPDTERISIEYKKDSEG